MKIQNGPWQAQAIQDLTTLFEGHATVRALLLKGSCANPTIQPDTWSDVDLTVIVADGTLAEFFPTLDWLAPLGTVYTFNQSSNDYTNTARVCLTDFRRFDCAFMQESALLAHPPHSEALQVLFSRSPLVDEALDRTILRPLPVPETTREQFEQMCNDFWFKGMLTTSKVMRGDLLIASHLALEMIQDTCVLAMMLRDQATGTSHHRAGGQGNTFITRLDAEPPHPFSATGILDSVQQSSLLFDELAAQWSPDYQPRRHPLLAWINTARPSSSSS
ncbi:hypothetical protein KDH_75220 [Dictyobacter sp. S3.2.2.5]|uniref:Aminoglycoside 6-adenylyltransferase n=1 Tax=Dictyobacter halimunensis TaxID=3026934 RepID=A0ABQ6G7A2_9CHLR|nr:hypothetical protein KDH_75220 [Dictyobacter sp. S3.2.2.5]